MKERVVSATNGGYKGILYYYYEGSCVVCGNLKVRRGRRFCSRKCFGESKKGKTSNFKGRKFSNESREKLSKSLKIHWKYHSPWNKGIRLPHLSGENSHRWKGGVTKIGTIIRGMAQYGIWRKSIFKRDNYTCVICNRRGSINLEVDHIKPFSQILSDNKITNPDHAVACAELWDISNGRTLCIECHKKTPTFPANLRYAIVRTYGKNNRKKLAEMSNSSQEVTNENSAQ